MSDDDSSTDFTISLDYSNFNVIGFALSAFCCIIAIVCLKQFVGNRYARFGNRTSKTKQVAASPCKIHAKWMAPSGYDASNVCVRLQRHLFGNTMQYGDDYGNLYFCDVEWLSRDEKMELYQCRHLRYQLLNLEAFEELDEFVQSPRRDVDDFKHSEDEDGKDSTEMVMTVMMYEPANLKNFVLKAEVSHSEHTWIPYVVMCLAALLLSVFLGFFTGGSGTAFTGVMAGIGFMIIVELYLRWRRNSQVPAPEDRNLVIEKREFDLKPTAPELNMSSADVLAFSA
eukprot:TRINITY_DN4787_c0_g1_i1.p1 TRINITY_DN4787_c0_g1~~TRINITY_DN4787_c0_g1_i1.p1  ORF type:complete len:309 (-),score=71.95 TRINITY_DN4787_c0_g1_i1:100-951(-)